MVYFDLYESPLGPLLLESDGISLTGLWMNRSLPRAMENGESPAVFARTKEWLDRYFRGEDPRVDVPVLLAGTPFQQAVWKRLREIPYGQTTTYGAIAREIGRTMGKEKMSAQAVGQAVGKNPVSILVPCHRVVGAGGKLTGYDGGLDKKIWLLRHEGWQNEQTRVAEEA